MLNFGDKVRITNSTSGNIVKRHGNTWEVFSDCKAMMCFNGEQGVLIRSILDGDMRNIKVADLELLC